MSTIFDKAHPGRAASEVPKAVRGPEAYLDRALLRADLPLPDVAEVEVVRHFTGLSRKNYGVDTGFYPLGSCTMKYNPKVNEAAARLEGFAALHPYQPEDQVQGALRLMAELQEALCEITGMEAFSLQPAAGAQGELTGILMIRAFHEKNGDTRRREVIVPDSAHGTNPATATMAGFDVVHVPSDARGGVNVEALKAHLSEKTAALMLTNPNTLGLFDEHIEEISQLVHEAGGLLYYDGANLNAIMGYCRPGDMGFDVVHLNLHKTFSTPHGGGGPGSGPVGVRGRLRPYLPTPTVGQRSDGTFFLDAGSVDSIGPVRSFFGNFGVLVRAYTYIRALGGAGLKEVSGDAVLNANYLLAQLRTGYRVPFDRPVKHEFVIAPPARMKEETGVKTLDIAKRLLDYGVHPPTVYFPLVVEEAMMIEPTETETRETLDAFASAMLEILGDARARPEVLKKAPHSTPVGRMDEAAAARRPDVASLGAETQKERG